MMVHPWSKSLTLPLLAATLCCCAAATDLRDICSCRDTGLPCERAAQQAVACYAGNFLVSCTATHLDACIQSLLMSTFSGHIRS